MTAAGGRNAVTNLTKSFLIEFSHDEPCEKIFGKCGILFNCCTELTIQASMSAVLCV